MIVTVLKLEIRYWGYNQMGLFFEVLSAINNPDQQASVSQLASVTNSIEQLSASRGIQPAQMDSMVSVLGGVLRSTLQKQQSTLGGNQLENLVAQAAGKSNNLSMLQSVFTPQLQQQITQAVAQKTGISPNLVQTVLPTLIPSVMGLLNMGSTKPGVQGSNSILTAFLDSDRDNDVDLGDVLKFSGRFLNPPR